MNIPVVSDEILIRSAKADKKQFEALYRQYKEKIYRHILYKVDRDRACADDICSVTFERAFTHLHSFQWQGISFSAYLYRIANNAIIDYYRSQNRNKLKSELHENIAEISPSIEERVLTDDSSYRVAKAIQKLTPREQDIVRYKFFEGFTNKKIAGLVNLSETNVSTILFRSMKKLRQPLSAI